MTDTDRLTLADVLSVGELFDADEMPSDAQACLDMLAQADEVTDMRVSGMLSFAAYRIAVLSGLAVSDV